MASCVCWSCFNIFMLCPFYHDQDIKEPNARSLFCAGQETHPPWSSWCGVDRNSFLGEWVPNVQASSMFETKQPWCLAKSLSLMQRPFCFLANLIVLDPWCLASLSWHAGRVPLSAWQVAAHWAERAQCWFLGTAGAWLSRRISFWWWISWEYLSLSNSCWWRQKHDVHQWLGVCVIYFFASEH